MNRPPAGLPGLNPDWSRNVRVPSSDGTTNTWHILDTGESTGVTGTILCVHGNPSWSYLFRNVLANAPVGWRVIAVDHLDMGFSDRTGITRPLAKRIADLGELTDTLGLDGPVVTLAHDWGGPISLGWAHNHREQLAGIILSNTAVHQPEGASAPTVIRAARTPFVLPALTSRSTNFIRGGLLMSTPPPPRAVRAGFYAPYKGYDRRVAIQEFVADIPLDPDHVSAATLDGVAAGLADFADVATLLLWGPKDLVFSDLYLQDLITRLPHADVHRYAGSSHFVVEDAPTFAADVATWINGLATNDYIPAPERPPGQSPIDGEQSSPHTAVEHSDRLWSRIDRRANDSDAAIIDIDEHGGALTTTFATLATRTKAVAAGLASIGVTTGSRVALLVPPGADLAAALYGVWRAGGVAVVVDAGLGLKGIRAALRGAGPDFIIGTPKGLAAARLMGLHAVTVVTAPVSATKGRVVGVDHVLSELEATRAPAPPEPAHDDLAAVVFTSGATGPSKGVRYTHRRLEQQRTALESLYNITADDRLVAAFGPFALFGPALGITSATPHMDMTAPATLTANSLGTAVRLAHASLVFGSPAALRNVVATSSGLESRNHAALREVRLLLSTGAPVPATTLRAMLELTPAAQAHTPYGMTEVLPIADISVTELELAGGGNGVCVGRPVPNVTVSIAALDHDGIPGDVFTTDADVTGEICITAAHGKDSYDRLAVTEHATRTASGAHRSGDVGHFDVDGRLWIEGRLAHLITTQQGPVTPYGLENAANTALTVTGAAAVGVGPVGNQVVVLVVTTLSAGKRGLAPGALQAQVRQAIAARSDIEIAAVLVVDHLPVDIRHNSKIDRVRVGTWAGRLLAGRRAGRV